MGDGEGCAERCRSDEGDRAGAWIEVVPWWESKDREVVEKGGSHASSTYSFNVESKRGQLSGGGDEGRITICEYSSRGTFTMVIEGRMGDYIAASVAGAIVGRRDGTFKQQFRDGKVVILMETFSNAKGAFLRITQVATKRFTSIIIPEGRSQAWLRFKMCLKITIRAQQGHIVPGISIGGNGGIGCASGLKVGLVVMLTRTKGDAEWEKIGEELSVRCGRLVEPIPVFDEKGFVWCANHKEV